MDHASWLEYEKHIQHIKDVDYPALKGTTYLDHAGTTPTPKSLIERFSADMIANLYGNPHSASNSSQMTTRRIDDIRHDALRFFNADPAHFDLVFVANATAGIKLVTEAFRDIGDGFWYGYHKDSHTSLVGAREVARLGSRCFGSDEEVAEWLENGTPLLQDEQAHPIELFAYPAQSNMNGRRLPLEWCRKARQSAQASRGLRYTLLDAAALVSTSPLDLNDADSAPDFTVLSFYKIFGFPDLGALIVRKSAANILRRRRYFGGGTVDMVVCLKEQWHVKKSGSLHVTLEDGTLPIHSILALGHAMAVHRDLFGSMENVSWHTASLADTLFNELKSLRHANGVNLCEIYKDAGLSYGNRGQQGPIIAFNMRNSSKAWISNAEVEKLASIRNIEVRTGGLCNPGGIASAVGLEPWEMKENFSAGQRCDNDNDIMGGKPTGMIRVSLGAMSTLADVHALLAFLREFYVDDTAREVSNTDVPIQAITHGDFYVESLTIYPIKSCGAWKIPSNTSWEVKNEGLAWDREWCLVHQSTGAALSQKRYPKMTLFRPHIDFVAGQLRVKYLGSGATDGNAIHEVTVPLSADPRVFGEQETGQYRSQDSTVCGDHISAKVYTSKVVSEFFATALGVPCHLARFASSSTSASARHAKAHLRVPIQQHYSYHASTIPRPILLSNESPILTISRSSLNRLNEQIKYRRGKAAQAEVFRANIVLAQDMGSVPGTEQPYAEDHWTQLEIGTYQYEVLGPCRRCQMVCVDQQTAEKDEEPFVTLAKTRRSEGKVWFGVHTCAGQGQSGVRIRVGDRANVLATRNQA